MTPIPDAKTAPVPLYWYRPPQSLSAAAGMHRFLWDVHYQPIAGASGGGRGAGPGGGGRGEGGPRSTADTLRSITTLLASQMNAMQAADVAPTANTLAAVTAALRAGDEVMARWAALTAKDLPALNATLKAAGLPAIGGGSVR